MQAQQHNSAAAEISFHRKDALPAAALIDQYDTIKKENPNMNDNRKTELVISASTSNEQWEKSKETSVYIQPITAATDQCVSYMVDQIRISPETAFLQNGNKWEINVPPISGNIEIGSVAYPFTLTSRLECEGYARAQNSFNFSRLLFHYGFKFNDFTRAYTLGEVHVDTGGIIHDFQIYGVPGRNNTHKTAISFLNNDLKGEFPDCLQGVAQSMLQHNLHTLKNKSKSKHGNI